MRNWILVTVWMLAVGCEDHSLDWCELDPVGDAAVAELGLDPAYKGQMACVGAADNASCRAADGTLHAVDGGDAPFEHYCGLTGFAVDCGDGVFLREGEVCPGDADTGP